MTGRCAIPGCETPAKDRQLMCWPHWRRVPKALNRAIFATYRAGMGKDYRDNVAEAVRIVQDKETAEVVVEQTESGHAGYYRGPQS